LKSASKASLDRTGGCEIGLVRHGLWPAHQTWSLATN
jgi:hypothetical protein